MKLGLIVISLFLLIGIFLFVWYHIECMQDELEQLNSMDDQ